MEDRKEEGYDDSDIQEHGPELWFSNWERQCLADAERTEPSDAGASDHDQRNKLWHLFQTTATAVAQLYKDPGCHHHHNHYHQQQQHGASLWAPFQNAAAAVTNLYKEAAEARQRSYKTGVQVGHQRRNRDVLSWAKKRRRTIHREDLIGFLCGKTPPPRRSGSRANGSKPRPAETDPASSDVVSSSAGMSDLQPLREAVTVQALNGAMASITVCSGAPGSPTHGSRGGSRNVGVAAGGHSGELWRGGGRRGSNSGGLHEVDLSTFISSTGSARKRNHTTQCGSEVFTHTPTPKRSRI